MGCTHADRVPLIDVVLVLVPMVSSIGPATSGGASSDLAAGRDHWPTPCLIQAKRLLHLHRSSSSELAESSNVDAATAA
eukprot:2015668-Lingulodinium_polyedra.AAC.1